MFYLTEFNVRVNSTYSDIQEQEMGVPQGSILSVTLFSIKINSLAKILNDNKSKKIDTACSFLAKAFRIKVSKRTR
jgi:hypothetical protein